MKTNFKMESFLEPNHINARKQQNEDGIKKSIPKIKKTLQVKITFKRETKMKRILGMLPVDA